MMHLSSVSREIKDLTRTRLLLLALYINLCFNGDHLRQIKPIYLTVLYTQFGLTLRWCDL